MKLKKYFLVLIGIVCFITVLGGCSMYNKSTLTKEQQDNVVRWIARGYNISKVEFLNFEQNKSTGSYNLVFRVDNKKITNIVQAEDIREFKDSDGEIGLDLVEEFVNLEKDVPLKENTSVDISHIKIIYLEN